MSQPIDIAKFLGAADDLGLDEDTLGPQFRARAIVESERYRLLDRQQAYHPSTQHEWMQYDYDGLPIQVGNPLLGQPMLSSQPCEW